jgi:hypothetical protein
MTGMGAIVKASAPMVMAPRFLPKVLPMIGAMIRARMAEM